MVVLTNIYGVHITPFMFNCPRRSETDPVNLGTEPSTGLCPGISADNSEDEILGIRAAPSMEGRPASCDGDLSGGAVPCGQELDEMHWIPPACTALPRPEYSIIPSLYFHFRIPENRRSIAEAPHVMLKEALVHSSLLGF